METMLGALSPRELGRKLVAGTISYSKLRALTRIHGADDETDGILLVAAHAGTASDMERLARQHDLLVEQESPPAENSWERCGLRVVRRNGGTATIEVVVPDEDCERLLAIVDATLKTLATEDSAESTGPVDTRRSWTQRR